MDILVDENITLASVEELQQMGHNVLDIRDTPDEGISDELLWNKACQAKYASMATSADTGAVLKW